MNQWIRLKSDGTIFKLKIDGYNDDNEWLKTSFRFNFEDIINYKADRVEVFTRKCLNYLIKYTDKLLKGKLKKKIDLSFFEPDFEFTFLPASYICPENHPNKNDPFDFDISLELRVYFWHNGATANHCSITFERKEIEKLYAYLLEVKNN